MNLAEQEPASEAAPPTRWRSAFHTVEATLGVMFAFLFGFAFIIIGGCILLISRGQPGVTRAAAGWTVVAVAEAAFLMWLKGSLEAGYRPFIPQFALSQYRCRCCFGLSLRFGG